MATAQELCAVCGLEGPFGYLYKNILVYEE